MASVRLRCNQEEILKLHRLGRRPLCQPHALAFAEEECNRISYLHAGEMDSNARTCAHAERMEGCLCVGRVRFRRELLVGGEPTVRVKATIGQYDEVRWGWVSLTSRDPTISLRRGEMCTPASRLWYLGGCSDLLVCRRREERHGGDC